MKKERSNELTYNMPVLVMFQGGIFLVSLLFVSYIITAERYSFALCFLYPLVASGWILMLGNGRLSMNIDECKHTTNISNYKYKYLIVVTSAKDNVLSSVDFWYQIVGYILIPIGLILSTIVKVNVDMMENGEIKCR